MSVRKKKNYMGVDIGTSGCKAVVFGEDGAQVASAYREYDLVSPSPGLAELDSDLVIKRCFEVISDVAGKCPDIRGFGISSQGEAFTPLDAKGKALCNALVSSDVRAVEYAKKWPKTFGEKKLYRITGHTAHPMFSLFKLLWLRDRRPDVWKKAARYLCFEDLLQLRLGLDPAMGWPLAGRTMLFDVRTHKWDPEILEAVGLVPEQLARPLPSGSVAGTISRAIARRLGLGRNVIVVAGGHDQSCGALGAGVTAPGVAMYATGTVECIAPAFSEPILTEGLRKSNLCTYDHTVSGMYATVAFSLTGGNILKWFRDQFGAEEVRRAHAGGRSAYDLLLAEAGDDPSGLLVLPYFTPSGTPYFDTSTNGAILGLRLSTTRGEVLRALLEGVAFEMRLNLEILDQSGCKVSELRAIGGGAKSPVWTQLKADVIGKPITALNETEAGCLGVAMLAMAADTGTSVKKLSGQMVTPSRTFVPDPERGSHYNQQFAAYKRMYPVLKELFCENSWGKIYAPAGS